MAEREEGWPLGLQPLNARVGLARNRDFSGGSVSFSTLLTGSPTSSIGSSSSDLDTESTRSFYHDRSITLGSLIGISSIIELSRRSLRRSLRGSTKETQKDKRNCKSRPYWLFSLCSKLNDTDVVSKKNNAPPSLGHFLVAERQAATASNTGTRNESYVVVHGPNDFSPVSKHNSLFINGQIAPQQNAPIEAVGGRKSLRELLEHGNRYGAPLFFSCLRLDNFIK